MTGFLIDTNVLSEYNRHGRPQASVKLWLETTDRQSQFVSVITLAEIQKGIELLPESKRRMQLAEWLERDLEAWFSGRVLPWIAKWLLVGPRSWRGERKPENRCRLSTP